VCHLRRLETLLATSVRCYPSDRTARALERERLQELGSNLEVLLESRLPEDPRWDPDDWVDGILPERVDVPPASHLRITGLVVWAPLGGSFHVDPFEATVTLSETADKVVHDRLAFGNAQFGLGLVDYGLYASEAWGLRRKPSRELWEKRWDRPTEWLFFFEGGGCDD
jgi:hypothetical protein